MNMAIIYLQLTPLFLQSKQGSSPTPTKWSQWTARSEARGQAGFGDLGSSVQDEGSVQPRLISCGRLMLQKICLVSWLQFRSHFALAGPCQP